MSPGSSNPIGSIHIDNGVWSVGVIAAIVGIMVLATTPVAGALVDDTRAPQQQTAVPDNNTTSTPESNSTELSDASTENTTANRTATTSTANTTNASTVASSQSANGTDSGTVANGTVGEAGNGSATVTFSVPNQTTNGSQIEVVAPQLPNGGFLVVHDSSFPTNGFGSTIGVSEYIAPNSSYSRAEIQLFDVPGRSFEQSQLRRPTTLYVRAALDTNGNQRYDYLATGGAQDVGYVVDGRQAVLSTQVDVDQPVSSGEPAAQYGIDTNGSTSSTATGSSGSETGSASENTSTSNSSNPIPLGESSNPIGAGNGGGNGSENGSNNVPVETLGQQIGQMSPLLVLVAGGAIWMYFRYRS